METTIWGLDFRIYILGLGGALRSPFRPAPQSWVNKRVWGVEVFGVLRIAGLGSGDGMV